MNATRLQRILSQVSSTSTSHCLPIPMQSTRPPRSPNPPMTIYCWDAWRMQTALLQAPPPRGRRLHHGAEELYH